MRKGACNSVYGEIQTWLPILFLVIPYTVMHMERMRSQLRQRYTRSITRAARAWLVVVTGGVESIYDYFGAEKMSE